MIRELSQHIRLLPVGQTVTDAVDLMSLESFTLDIQPESDDDGTFWKLERTITVEEPDATALRLFRTATPCLIQLWDHTGATYHIGSRGIPAHAILSPYLNNACLAIRAEMTANPLER